MSDRVGVERAAFVGEGRAVLRIEGSIRSAKSAPEFERACFMITGKKVARLFVIAPADESSSFDHGSMGIEGRYKVIEKINGAAEAARRWKSFQAR